MVLPNSSVTILYRQRGNCCSCIFIMFIHKPDKSLVLVLLTVLGLFFGSTNSYTAISQQPEQTLRQTISTLHKARNNLVLQHEKVRQNGLINESGHNNFLLFISYLDRRIYYYCRELYLNFGTQALSGMRCPPETLNDAPLNQYSTVPTITGPTHEEKLSQLNSNFEKSLQQFDDMLIMEQEKISQTIPKKRENSRSEKSGYPPSDGSDQNNDYSSSNQASRQEKQNEPTPGSPEQSNYKTKKTGSQVIKTATNKNLSDNDDDIVAKQLKEAAEQEADPEIQAKLWEEYRKYKEGTR